jgi:hypothetical protein
VSAAKVAAHTPGPWHIGVREAEKVIYDAHGWAVANCTMYQGQDSPEPKANADFIVRACNAHDDLLAALITAVRVMQDNNIDESMAGEFEQFTDAIAKAQP